MTDQPPRSLAEMLARAAADTWDIQGRMLHGDRWPEVKAKAGAERLRVAAEADERAKAERRRDLLWHVVLAYFLCCLAALALPLVVLVWRAAW